MADDPAAPPHGSEAAQTADPSSWLSLASFFESVERAKAQLTFNAGEECFYRGHRSASYELLPTLQRHCRQQGISDLAKVQDLEANLFFEFQARSAQLDHQSRDDWDLLFTMRHHGVTTRLLDWTETLGVALYFALDGAKEADQPRLWLLNPWRLNEENWNKTRDLIAPRFLGRYQDRSAYEDYGDFLRDYHPPGMVLERPVALYPIHLNRRLHAQRGYFTIHGDVNKPVDALNPDCVTALDIPAEVIGPARHFLTVAGIDDYLMFPDLDGLARDLHRKNGIGTAPSASKLSQTPQTRGGLARPA